MGKENVKIRLLRTPRPYFDESLKGLIVRAAEENCYHTSSLLISFADAIPDIRTKQLLFKEQQFKKLSGMLNLGIPALQDLACLLGIEGIPPKAYNMFGHRIHKYSVRTAEPKICPGCLRESNHIRKIWDLVAFTCCPKHRTLLIRSCPKCEQTISWNRHKVSACGCGQDWRDLFLPEVADSETTLSRLILRVCGLWESDKSMEGAESNPLSAGGLSEVLCAVYFISGLQHGVVDATGKQYAVMLSHKELHDALTNAVVVFENWPDNYYKFIDLCRGKISMRTGQSGLYKDFGKLYDPLFVRKRNPLPDFMRDAFKRYITTQWDSGYAGWCSSISDEELKTKKYMTRHEVVKYLQVSLTTVNRLHKKSFIRGDYQPWVNRSRIMIEADSVRELKERWDKSITSVQAGKMLGIGRKAVASLVKNGCLAAIQGPTVTGQTEWKFEAPEVKELFHLVKGKIPMGTLDARAPRVSLYKAIQKLSKLKIAVGAFVKLILDGKVTPIAKGNGIGLASLLFDAGEIKRFSKAEAVERRGDKRTLQEAARLLRVPTRDVVFLIERGLLLVEKAAGGRGGTWAIAQNEIDRFNAIYSPAGRMANAFGAGVRGVSERLIANGIMPVTGPKIDGGSIYFFKKVDLEEIDLAIIRPAAKESITQEMNNKGFVLKKQLSEMFGYTPNQIDRLISTGQIVPVRSGVRGRDNTRLKFFSLEEIEKFKKNTAA